MSLSRIKTLLWIVALGLFAACSDEESVEPVDTGDPSEHDMDVYTQAKSADDYKNSDIKYGKMTDSRDGKVYRTIIVDGLEWMAENLDFSDSTLLPNIEGANWCYDNEPDFCKVGGRLYTWAAAMNLSSDMLQKRWNWYNKSSSARRGVCPEGWVIPSSSEFSYLTLLVGRYSEAGKLLKSTRGWRGLNGNGLDSVGFTVIPTGYYAKGDFYNAGFEGVFWTSKESDYSYSEASVMRFNYESSDVAQRDQKKEFGYSVRCVKDTAVIRIAQNDSSAKIEELELVREKLYDTANVVRGTFVDPRDSRKYRTVKIGSQTWMAENMDYRASDSVSACYARKDSLCEIYGRLYTHEFAQDSVCPDGWHLPTRSEFNVLQKMTGYAGVVDIYFVDVSGLTLKGKETWADRMVGSEAHDGNGLDLYGFDVLAGGRGVLGAEVDSFYNRGENAYFWGYDVGDGNGYTMELSHISYSIDFNIREKNELASVRCIQGEKPLFYECPADTSKYKAPLYTEKDSSFTEGGYLHDFRDNKFYKVVTIGKQTWMAENLNFQYKEYTKPQRSDRKSCYADSLGVCDSLGAFYSWVVAMDMDGLFTSADDFYCRRNEVRRGMCPMGWHLPSVEEWNELIETVGDPLAAAVLLKSKSAWNGTDAYGFGVLPAGRNPGSSAGSNKGRDAYFWTSADDENLNTRLVHFNEEIYSLMDIETQTKNQWISVRCIKDSALLSEAVEIQKSEISLAPACKDAKKDNCAYGELVDDRDGHVYKTVQIGSQTWMAENLELANEGSPKLGFYYWSAAVDTVGEYSDCAKDCDARRTCNIKEPLRGICPEGWHIPSIDEWKNLFAFAGGKAGAWNTLKSSEGWSENAGVDALGWNAVPTGYWFAADTSVHKKGDVAHFWSWEKGAWIYRMSMGFYADSTSGYEFRELGPDVGANIRCLKDE